MRYLYFTSEYCAPCKMLKPKIVKHREIDIIDVDKNRDLTNRYGIMSIPTIIVLDNRNSVETQISGSRIGKWLNETFRE